MAYCQQDMFMWLRGQVIDSNHTVHHYKIQVHRVGVRAIVSKRWGVGLLSAREENVRWRRLP